MISGSIWHYEFIPTACICKYVVNDEYKEQFEVCSNWSGYAMNPLYRPNSGINLCLKTEEAEAILNSDLGLGPDCIENTIDDPKHKQIPVSPTLHDLDERCDSWPNDFNFYKPDYEA